MRVFVTGASGHIGFPVVKDLLEGGHQVVGLARSDESAETLTAAGAEVLRGSLDDVDSLRRGAAGADGVIHLAFIHDFSNFAASAAADKQAIETIGTELAGSQRPLVVTSGTLGLASPTRAARIAKEDDAPNPQSPRRSEFDGLAFAGKGVRASAVRLAPSVHSSLDHHGFVPQLIAIAREKGVVAYVGEGVSRWPAVHTLDAAHLFRLAVESAPAGAHLHGVGDEGIPFREIAEAIGRKLKLPVVSISPEEAGGHFGFLGAFAQLDNPTSSARTQELLRWRPIHPGLIADLEDGHYFRT